ncbi:MAG: S-adenosylmethionine:tRNA ribosyltransferase-isomerase, partial [Deltaproteobacteria bacterium]|nr:S-adenosylmethionine:tRNA ribosyltransferase-isomerase [Deltaproteobacteria bacterium]
MKIEDFDFALPPEQIAQKPLEPRDSSRLLVCEAAGGRLGALKGPLELRHAHFRDVAGMLGPNDFLVMNDAKVLPVRLLGARAPAPGTTAPGGAVEALLLRRTGP